MLVVVLVANIVMLVLLAAGNIQEKNGVKKKDCLSILKKIIPKNLKNFKKQKKANTEKNLKKLSLL